MSRKVIVVGDRTTHGGVVISGAESNCVAGKPIARVGDMVTCPEHGTNAIIEGASSMNIKGVPVTLEGCKTECGSVLIGSVSVSTN